MVTETRVNGKERALLIAVRQGLLIIVGAIEEYLGLDRTVVPKHKRKDERLTNIARTLE